MESYAFSVAGRDPVSGRAVSNLVIKFSDGSVLRLDLVPANWAPHGGAHANYLWNGVMEFLGLGPGFVL